MSANLSPDELEEIFDARNSEKSSEWKTIKENFYDVGLENILSEEIDGLTFHVLYLKIMSFTDEEIFEHLLDEL